MVKLENEINLQVTFSKRHAGLFKKASELSILCGVESALIVFSPGDKDYSFENPNVEIITKRFWNINYIINNNNNNGHNIIDVDHDQHMTHSNMPARQQNQKLSRVEAQLKQEND